MNDEGVEIMARFKQDLSHEDDATNSRIQEVQMQINQLDAFLKNHQTQLLKYDAIINGQAAKTVSMESDFTDIRKQAVVIEKHDQDLGLLDKNLRDLIRLQENKIKDQESSIRSLNEALRDL